MIRNIITITITLFPIFMMAQSQKQFGVFAQGTSGSAWIKDPSNPKDGTFAFNFIQGFGGGASIDIRINDRISLDYRISYIQKGFQGASQKDVFNTPKALGVVKMHYIGLDHVLKLWVKPEKVYLLGGLRNDRMIASNLPDSFENPGNSDQVNRNDYHLWSFGGITGLGYDYNGSLYFEAGMNFDISPTLESSSASFRNYLWYASAGLRLF